ncbi:hypothetical protein [Halopelagius longus]|uniref:Uncharacterized protein n=1 Tax=Halopelagius longus TaxID=1236180 RepID=A0A1H0YD06_9EURY|nr:hypothetical protein [Halopelagius longus]RDI72422.1 hypothetical protein DWB78_12245 [Halopelagius longus]SDQ13085.1 hypothetical protein SAMN05216278_0564 [Halopelagius longus]
MPSDTDALLRSIRRWLLVCAFLLGVGAVALSEAGLALTGYENKLAFTVAGVAGTAVAIVSGSAVLASFVAVGSGGSTE